MNPTDPTAAQKAARAAAIEQQMAAQAAMASRQTGVGGHQHHHSPYNIWIVIGVLLIAIGSFVAMVLKGG